MNNSKANSEAKIFYKFLNDWLEFVFDGAVYDIPTLDSCISQQNSVITKPT